MGEWFLLPASSLRRLGVSPPLGLRPAGGGKHSCCGLPPDRRVLGETQVSSTKLEGTQIFGPGLILCSECPHQLFPPNYHLLPNPLHAGPRPGALDPHPTLAGPRAECPVNPASVPTGPHHCWGQRLLRLTDPCTARLPASLISMRHSPLSPRQPAAQLPQA